MTVWLVEKGEHCEGGHVRGIYSDPEKALKAVLGMHAHYDYAPWVEGASSPSPTGARTWTSGCDWISMTPREVE